MATLKRQNAPPGIPTDPAYYKWSVQKDLTAIDLSLLLLALVTVIGRIYIRTYVLRVYRLDDCFIVAAMVCSVLGCSIFLHVVQLGMGKHIFAIPPENMMPLLMWIFIFAILIPMALGFAKLSIAFFLLSFTRQVRYRRFLWGIIISLVLLMLFSLFSIVFGCVPISANWNFALRPPPLGTGNAKCLDFTTYRNIALATSLTNIFTDILLALLPIPLIWALQVNKRTKASLIFVLGVGFFACAAGIIKTPLLYHFFDDMDSTGNRSWYYAWQMIEMNVGIIAASLPSLQPAFRWLLETAKAFTTAASGNRTGASTGYKRQLSSVHIAQRSGNSNNTGRMKGRDEVDIELDALGPYQVTIVRDEKSPSGSARASDASSDAILGVEGVNATRSRGIVKTTEVTINTSQI